MPEMIECKERAADGSCDTCPAFAETGMGVSETETPGEIYPMSCGKCHTLREAFREV